MQWIHPFLQAQNLSYLILLVEQTEEKQFNRAKLFNIGVIESKVRKCQIELLVFSTQKTFT